MKTFFNPTNVISVLCLAALGIFAVNGCQDNKNISRKDKSTQSSMDLSKAKDVKKADVNTSKVVKVEDRASINKTISATTDAIKTKTGKMRNNITVRSNDEKPVKKPSQNKKKATVKKTVTKKAEKPVAKPQKLALAQFYRKNHSFGRVEQGDTVTHNFKFKNTGNTDLVIDNVEVSCGCTQPSFPFIPIEPGETGFIGVVFKSEGRLGKQKPQVTVKSNAEGGDIVLTMDGLVVPPEKEEPKDQDKDSTAVVEPIKN